MSSVATITNLFLVTLGAPQTIVLGFLLIMNYNQKGESKPIPGTPGV